MTRRERFVARLSLQVNRVLSERLAETGRKKRRDPLVSILRELGYSIHTKHPYGHDHQRENLMSALDVLRRGGQFDIAIETLDGSVKEPDIGDRGDHLWVSYGWPGVQTIDPRRSTKEAQ